MFNLIISADEEAWERPSYVLKAERFLEYTDDELRKQFKALDDQARMKLMALPTLFAYESPSSKAAHFGWLKTIEKQGDAIRIMYAFEPVAVDAARVPALAWDSFEMTRTHWAVKEGDLVEMLGLDKPQPRVVPPPPVFSFTRRTLLTACDRFRALTHADLDRFLLEVGISEINAGRDGGRSLATRANALAEFLIKNPSARTAEGEPLALRVVRQAVEVEDRLPESMREAFRSALESDGYDIDGGKVVPSTYATIKNIEVDVGFEKPLGQVPGSSSVPEFRPPQIPPRMTPSLSKKVFLVHGRDDGAKHEVARFLEKLGLEVVILHERPNGGRTLITKFQEESAGVGFAVVMMTADDLGGLKPREGSASTELVPRARQNVVFELGFFVGKLGSERVCALVAGTVERPSDFEGVVYVPFGQGTTWKTDLARELRHARVPFDPANVL